ncbi:MAG TPA: type II secretion system F family protein [Acidimicrobiales bacterium]|nr:type II secretion system F family protein [Acidimicrobiales bacterium]
MSKFAYTTINPEGKEASGVIEAVSSNAAAMALGKRDIQPLSLVERKSLLQFEITKKKVKRKELMHFSRQLAVFVKAGVPILEALEVINEEVTDKRFHLVIDEMVEGLRAGDTFSAVAAAHPQAFPEFYVGVLTSAELTGELDNVLNQLSEYIERDIDANGKLTAALVYPAIIMLMSIVTVLVMAIFVLPRFRTFFTSLHAKLPLPTRLLLGLTGLVTTYWYVFALILVGGPITIGVMLRTKGGRARLDGIALKIPVLGDLIAHSMLERVCRVLSSMIRAGVPLPEAMTVTGDSTNNAVWRRGIRTAREQMLEGQGLSGPLARTGLFPGAARQMFRVGEETGTLDEQLRIAADYYSRELDHQIKRFTALFEPAVIIFMGLVVGFVAVALVSAMYGIYSQVKVT